MQGLGIAGIYCWDSPGKSMERKRALMQERVRGLAHVADDILVDVAAQDSLKHFGQEAPLHHKACLPIQRACSDRKTEINSFSLNAVHALGGGHGGRMPDVPSSAIRKLMTCSGVRCIALHSSLKLTNTVFFVPSRSTCAVLLSTQRTSTKPEGAGGYLRRLQNRLVLLAGQVRVVLAQDAEHTAYGADKPLD